MSQQGGRPTRHEDEWWGQLYDDDTDDTGPTPAPDSLDDRYASASGAVAGPRRNPDQDPDPDPDLDLEPDPDLDLDPPPDTPPPPTPAPDVARPPGPYTAPDRYTAQDPYATPDPYAGETPTSTPDPYAGATPTPDPYAGATPSTDSYAGETPTSTPDPYAAPGPPPRLPERSARSDDPTAPTGADRWGRPADARPKLRPAAAGPELPPDASPDLPPDASPDLPPQAAPPDPPASPARPDGPQPPTGPGWWEPSAPAGPPPAPESAAPPASGSPAEAPVDAPASPLPPEAPPPRPRPAPPADSLGAVLPEPLVPASADPLGAGPPEPLAPALPVASAAPASPVDHVGSGPPTYDAEPTALPAADPGDLEDLVPDTVLDGARYGPCTLRAVSVRGDSARFRGEPRRDALLTARFGSGERALVLVAMATGARATPGAHRAAAELCRLIGQAVGRSHTRLVEDIHAARRGELKSGLHRLTDRSLGKLRALAAEQGVEPQEYAASLRCLLLPARPDCRTRVFFGVGEGGLFRLRDGVWRDIEPQVTAGGTTGAAVVGFGSLPAETPEGDRFTMDLGIPTPPSPYEPAPEPPREPFRFLASVARPGDALLMCTAGLADPLLGEPALCAYLARRWSGGAAPGLAAFLADSQVRVKGYADDRTLAAVWEA